jgi:hypothetical protein
VKSSSGTPNHVAASPPDAFLQSRQWQTAMNSEMEMFVKRRLKWVKPLGLPEFPDMPN